MYELRDYQEADLESLRELVRSGKQAVVYVCPTGGGKTVTASRIIQSAARKNRRVMFVAHRRELVTQCSEKLDALGVHHGIVMANHPRYQPAAPVQVCSIQTLIRRARRPVADIIFVDEAHRSKAATYEALLSCYPHAIIIGLTATPIRRDGKGLGDIFAGMVNSRGIGSLILDGALVRPRTYAPPAPAHLDQVRVLAGDYDERELNAIMNQPGLIGNIVEHWIRFGEGRQTVVFAVTIDHSQKIVERFRAAGVATEHLDGTMAVGARDGVLHRLRTGTTRVVSNCAVLTEGWDCPPVSCVILARPTMSLGLYLQMCGRSLRPWGNKRDCIILDHAGCVWRHGLVQAERHWELHATPARRSKGKKNPTLVKMCPSCQAIVEVAARVCDQCGYEFKSRPINEQEGQLEEIAEDDALYGARRRGHYWIDQIRTIQEKRGYKYGWVYHVWQRLRPMSTGDRRRILVELQEGENPRDLWA